MKPSYLLSILPMILFGCKKESSSKVAFNPTPYTFEVPRRFPEPILPLENPMTVEGVSLGRMLYYDSILSSNGLACASCHLREKSFSLPLFISKSGEKISVPPHVNLAWNPDYNWNGSELQLEHLPLGDFGPDFFNTNMPQLIVKLQQHKTYPSLFKQAFNIDHVSDLSNAELQQTIVNAITQFMRSMVSCDSRYDKMVWQQISFTPEEQDGFETFVTERGDCFHCHGYPLFTSNQFYNNGLDSIISGANLGRYMVTNNPFDKGKFSAPTLRNIELTAPYMHDGRFKSLEEVVDFYNSGVHWNSPNIDPIMTKAAKKYGLNLSKSQKANLVLFLKTLTDTGFINNPKYKSPFK